MKSGFRLLVIFIAIVATVTIALVFTWWILSSTEVANTPLVIKVRHYYFFNFAPKLGLTQEKFPYTILPMQELKTNGGTTYAYILLGRYENIDFEKKILYLKTKRGQTYGFKFVLNPENKFSYQERTDGAYEMVLIPIDPANPGNTPTPFTTGEVISVQWTDRRLLTEILANATNDLEALVNPNMTDSDFQLINKASR